MPGFLPKGKWRVLGFTNLLTRLFGCGDFFLFLLKLKNMPIGIINEAFELF